MAFVPISRFKPAELMSRCKFNDVGEFKGSPTDKLNILTANKNMVRSLEESSTHWTKFDIAHGIYLDINATDLFYIRSILFVFKLKSGYSWQCRIDIADSIMGKVVLDMAKRGIVNKSSLSTYETYWTGLFKNAVNNNPNLSLNYGIIAGGM